MTYTLRMKTPLYMGKGTWLNEDFTMETAGSYLVKLDGKREREVFSLNISMMLGLVCAAAFMWLTLGAVMPQFSSTSAILTPASAPHARFEWAGNRGRALISYQRMHMDAR